MKKSRVLMSLGILGSILLLAIFGCSTKKSSDPADDSGTSYNFTATANAAITSAGRGGSFKVSPFSSTGPTLCSSVICFTPTSVSGKYYGAGLSIQSGGSGMMAYFGQETWGDITGASTSYTFSASSPVVNAGTLTCCAGTGDLASENTYIESVAYLFSYLDVTFAVTGITGNTSMNATYTLRFVLADDAIEGGLRGDVLISDSGVFKWMDSGTSVLSTTRPTTPVTMNSSVTNYTNPFSATEGNQEIPVIYAFVVTPADSVMQITEDELRATGKTYSFAFNMTNFIVFPTVLTTDINQISSLKELMSRVHLGGLPHSAQAMGIGNPADTELTISE